MTGQIMTQSSECCNQNSNTGYWLDYHYGEFHHPDFSNSLYSNCESSSMGGPFPPAHKVKHVSRPGNNQYD
jgi:hypothetical protein